MAQGCSRLLTLLLLQDIFKGLASISKACLYTCHICKIVNVQPSPSWNGIAQRVGDAPNTINAATTPEDVRTVRAAFNAQSWLDSRATTDLNVDILKQQYAGYLHGLGPLLFDQKKDKLTVYEKLAQLESTTELVKYIDQFPKLKSALNDTESNYTIYAPTDAAFCKLLDNQGDLDKEFIGQIVQHHITPHLMPLRRTLDTPNVPILLFPRTLNGNLRLRLSPLSGRHGPELSCTNNHTRHHDEVVLPPSMLQVVSLLPHEFSMLQLGLRKTGLEKEIKDAAFLGGTLFEPTNDAFHKLGETANAFLFSETFYSNAFYNVSASPPVVPPTSSPGIASNGPNQWIIKERKTFVLHTMVTGRTLSLMYYDTAVQDVVANDDVVHIVSSVLIPPKEPDHARFVEEEEEEEERQELELQDLKARLEGCL
ncbi:FAS1 domain-containing protein [Lipomyces starkeyi]